MQTNAPLNFILPQKTKILILTLGALASLLGFFVLFGWFLNIPILIKISPAFNTMKFNTALGFFLGGIGLSFMFYRPRIVARISGCILSVIGILVLLQYIMGRDLGIDQLLFNDYLTDPNQHPGRMAPQAALCFLAFGLSLLIDQFVRWEGLVQFWRCFWGAFLLVIGFTAIFGFIFKIPFAYSWGSYNALAVHTAVGFIFLGTALMLTSYGKSYFPLVITFLGGVTISLQTYYGVSNIENELFRAVMPGLLSAMILLFTILIVLYLYYVMKKGVLIEENVVHRTQELKIANEKLHNEMISRQAAEAKKAEALEAKSEFISIVSHELRTPLTVIKGGIDAVLDEVTGPVNAEQKDMLDTAKRNVDRLARLINDVLDYQKLESGRTQFEMKGYDLHKLLRDTVCDFIPLAQRKGLTLNSQIAENPLIVIFDKDKIVQVVINFLNNALKFTDRGTIKVKSEVVGNEVKVSIEDQGLGIKEKDISKLFKSFSQISHEGERKVGGTGLGLSIVSKIIENHHGHVDVQSVFGQGTTFSFSLPLRSKL